MSVASLARRAASRPDRLVLALSHSAVEAAPSARTAPDRANARTVSACPVVARPARRSKSVRASRSERTSTSLPPVDPREAGKPFAATACVKAPDSGVVAPAPRAVAMSSTPCRMDASQSSLERMAREAGSMSYEPGSWAASDGCESRSAPGWLPRLPQDQRRRPPAVHRPARDQLGRRADSGTCRSFVERDRTYVRRIACMRMRVNSRGCASCGLAITAVIGLHPSQARSNCGAVHPGRDPTRGAMVHGAGSGKGRATSANGPPRPDPPHGLVRMDWSGSEKTPDPAAVVTRPDDDCGAARGCSGCPRRGGLRSRLCVVSASGVDHWVVAAPSPCWWAPPAILRPHALGCRPAGARWSIAPGGRAMVRRPAHLRRMTIDRTAGDASLPRPVDAAGCACTARHPH